MSGCNRRQEMPSCYRADRNEMRSGNARCMCGSKATEDYSKCSDKKTLERIEKESEEELENAKRTLENAEHAMRGRQSCARGNSSKPARRPCGKPHTSAPSAPTGFSGSREAIKRLSRVDGKECGCPDGRANVSTSCGRDKASPVKKEARSCPPAQSQPGKMEWPKKPTLTPEQLDELLDQETKDVESAWMLTSEGRESYKKPCPKQQKARESIKAIIEPRKYSEEPASAPASIPTCVLPGPPKELPPLIEPDPDDITPEIAANIMYTLERGVKMISCPEETVKHLFPQQFGPPTQAAVKDMDDAQSIKSVVEETEEGVNDAVYTRTKSQLPDDEEENQEGDGQVYTSTKTPKREFILEERASKCVNNVQLRGNYAPWFPGYYVAFPDQIGDRSIQVSKSPSGIFQKAWMAAKPNNIPANDLYLVE